ncbi:MAG: CBS domain-containing protein [Kofleriaceae bacterium]|nr:CBS domain-containing protein [Kofleriaceae bacterium]
MYTVVSDLMTTQVISLFEEQTLPLAGGIMKLKKVRHLPVIDDDGTLVGLVTHRDILRSQGSLFSLLHSGQRSQVELEVPVREIMTKDVWTVKPDTKLLDAGRLLADHQFSCLPVTDDGGRLVGIITDRDYLKFALEVLK